MSLSNVDTELQKELDALGEYDELLLNELNDQENTEYEEPVKRDFDLSYFEECFKNIEKKVYEENDEKIDGLKDFNINFNTFGCDVNTNEDDNINANLFTNEEDIIFVSKIISAYKEININEINRIEEESLLTNLNADNVTNAVLEFDLSDNNIDEEVNKRNSELEIEMKQYLKILESQNEETIKLLNEKVEDELINLKIKLKLDDQNYFLNDKYARIIQSFYRGYRVRKQHKPVLLAKLASLKEEKRYKEIEYLKNNLKIKEDLRINREKEMKQSTEAQIKNQRNQEHLLESKKGIIPNCLNLEDNIKLEEDEDIHSQFIMNRNSIDSKFCFVDDSMIPINNLNINSSLNTVNFNGSNNFKYEENIDYYVDDSNKNNDLFVNTLDENIDIDKFINLCPKISNDSIFNSSSINPDINENSSCSNIIDNKEKVDVLNLDVNLEKNSNKLSIVEPEKIKPSKNILINDKNKVSQCSLKNSSELLIKLNFSPINLSMENVNIYPIASNSDSYLKNNSLNIKATNKLDKNFSNTNKENCTNKLNINDINISRNRAVDENNSSKILMNTKSKMYMNTKESNIKFKSIKIKDNILNQSDQLTLNSDLNQNPLDINDFYADRSKLNESAINNIIGILKPSKFDHKSELLIPNIYFNNKKNNFRK